MRLNNLTEHDAWIAVSEFLHSDNPSAFLANAREQGTQLNGWGNVTYDPSTGLYTVTYGN